MIDRVSKNYHADGGERLVIGGVLEFGDGAQVKGFPGAVNLKPKTTTTGTDIRSDLNDLIVKLKNAGIMEPDEWELSVKACSQTSAMPTAQTISNSGHATPSVDDNEITITLDCAVSDLADADHGETWGTHKWLGFGVHTGLGSVVGIKFTDDTGASVTLASGDATEASGLGLSDGEFVLYIKAEDEKYLTGEKYFTLWADGFAETKFTMRVVEPDAE